jgi:hypothetical protein
MGVVVSQQRPLLFRRRAVLQNVWASLTTQQMWNNSTNLVMVLGGSLNILQ